MWRRIWHGAADERGAALVEMTIVTPFLIVLGLGIFEFSNLFYQRQLIVIGLHDAARYLSRVTDPADTTEQGKAKELAVYGRIGGTTPRVSWWTVANVSVNPAYRSIANSGAYRGPDPIPIIRVSTSVDHPGLGFLSILGLSAPLRIDVFDEERYIGD